MSLKVMEIFHVNFDRDLINTEVGILAGYICVTWLVGDISVNDIFSPKRSTFWYFSFQLCSLDVLWLRLGENQGEHLTSGNGPLFRPMDIWRQLFVDNIFLTRYLAERNTFLWNCIIWRKENPTSCQYVDCAFCFLEVWVVFIFNCENHLIISAWRKETTNDETLSFTQLKCFGRCIVSLLQIFSRRIVHPGAGASWESVAKLNIDLIAETNWSNLGSHFDGRILSWSKPSL